MATIKQIEAKSTDSSIELHLSADLIYPVGSIYMSVNSTNPSTLFGGTWEQIKDKFLLSCGDTYSNGSTGGSASHTIDYSNLPSQIARSMALTKHTNGSSIGGIDAGNWANLSLSDAGMETDKPLDTMPPYLAVYVWKRTK